MYFIIIFRIPLFSGGDEKNLPRCRVGGWCILFQTVRVEDKLEAKIEIDWKNSK